MITRSNPVTSRPNCSVGDEAQPKIAMKRQQPANNTPRNFTLASQLYETRDALHHRWDGVGDDGRQNAIHILLLQPMAYRIQLLRGIGAAQITVEVQTGMSAGLHLSSFPEKENGE